MSWKLRHTSKVFWSLYDGEIICNTDGSHAPDRGAVSCMAHGLCTDVRE